MYFSCTGLGGGGGGGRRGELRRYEIFSKVGTHCVRVVVQ